VTKIDPCAGALSIFWALRSDRILKNVKDINVYFFFTVSVPVNNIGEFRERFEPTTNLEGFTSNP